MNPEIRTIYAAKHREAARLFRETHPDAGVTYPAGVWNRVTPTSAAHRV